MSKKIVLAGAVRTAIGKMGGALANVPAATLGSIVIKEALKRANVAPDQVDEVLMGCVSAGCPGARTLPRQAAVNAGIPIEVPALTLNNVCGSGLKCREHGCCDDRGWRSGYRGRWWYGEHVLRSVCADQSSLWLSHEQCYHDRYYGQRCTLGCIQRLPHGHHR